MPGSKAINKIAMLSIHSSPMGALGTRDTGGMSVYVRELAKELGCLGIMVDVFTLCQDHSKAPVMRLDKNVRLVNLKINSGETIFKENLFDYLPAVFDAFNKTREKERLTYDLIHSHYWLSGVLGNRINQMYHTPHVVTFHTMGAIKNRYCANESEPEFRIEQEKQVATDCDRIVTSTLNEKNELILTGHASPEKIGVVLPGVNLSLFLPIEKDAARQNLGLNGKEQLLLYVGRNVPVKGLDRLLRILPDINRNHRFRLLIIGGDNENKKLNSMIRGLRIQGSVDLIGRKDHAVLPAYYNAADMLVVPSYHESFCLAGLESLSCGTPVVSMPVGGMPEIINRNNGCVVSEVTDRTLAEAIIRVANSLQHKGFSPKRIRSSVQGYCWSNTATLMMQQYHKITGNLVN